VAFWNAMGKSLRLGFSLDPHRALPRQAFLPSRSTYLALTIDIPIDPFFA